MNDKAKQKFNSMEAYKKTEVSTANRETILLMLYAGAIRFLKSAILASEKNEIQEKSKFISKTLDIVTELRSTLNHEVGGELSERLDSLYLFVSHRLTEGGIENKTEYLKEALTVLEKLQEAWEEAVQQIKKEK